MSADVRPGQIELVGIGKRFKVKNNTLENFYFICEYEKDDEEFMTDGTIDKILSTVPDENTNHELRSDARMIAYLYGKCRKLGAEQEELLDDMAGCVHPMAMKSAISGIILTLIRERGYPEQAVNNPNEEVA